MKINYTEGAGFFTYAGEEEINRIQFLYPCERNGSTYVFYTEQDDDEDAGMCCARLERTDDQWSLELMMSHEEWAIIDELMEEVNRVAQEAADEELDAALEAAVKAFVPSEHPVLREERRRELEELERYMSSTTPEERLLNAIFGVDREGRLCDDGEGNGTDAES